MNLCISLGMFILQAAVFDSNGCTPQHRQTRMRRLQLGRSISKWLSLCVCVCVHMSGACVCVLVCVWVWEGYGTCIDHTSCKLCGFCQRYQLCTRN